MPDKLTGATRTRKNTPRIGEIEDQINKLIKELGELVEPTEEERILCAEQVMDMHSDQVADTLGDYYLITDALDSRESIEEEEEEENAKTT